MKNKIEKQNELIDAIIDWNSKSKPLGYSKAHELINEYERQVKLFAIPDVSKRNELLVCCANCKGETPMGCANTKCKNYSEFIPAY